MNFLVVLGSLGREGGNDCYRVVIAGFGPGFFRFFQKGRANVIYCAQSMGRRYLIFW